LASKSLQDRREAPLPEDWHPIARDKTHIVRGCVRPWRPALGGTANGGPAPRPACGGHAARRNIDGSTSDLHTGRRSAGSRYPYRYGQPFVGAGTPGTSCRSPAAGALASFAGPVPGAPLLGRSRPGMSRPPVGPATTSRTGHTTRGSVQGRRAARRSGLRCLGPSGRCLGAGPVVETPPSPGGAPRPHR